MHTGYLNTERKLRKAIPEVEEAFKGKAGCLKGPGN